jgi:rRNA-processing protein EBP2
LTPCTGLSRHQGDAAEDGEIANVQDDLERESVFHRRALDAVAAARSKLGALGVPTRRPDDFYAEMMKNDAHMRKVKDKLLFEQRELEAKGERRREREAKRYGKAVQAERLKERKQQQKDSMGLLQRMKKRGAGVSASDVLADEPDWGEPGRQPGRAPQRQGRGGRQGGAGRGRGGRSAHKEAKFGFGGPKRGSKRNDAASAADVSGYRTPSKPGQRGRGGGRGRGGRGRGRR